MSLLDEIIQIRKEGYDHNKVADLFKRYSSLPLVELLVNTRGTEHFKTMLELFTRILESPLYSDFIKDGGDSIQILLNDSDPKVRILVSDCMESHDYEFSATIAQLYEAKNVNLLLIILQVLIKQLCDQEAEVGLKAMRTLRKIFSQLALQLHPQLIDVLKLEPLVNMLKTALTLDKDIVQLRFMEVIITLANYDESIFNRYLQEGIMYTVVGILDTDDILVKLNAVELIHKMGESSWCAQFLQKQKFFHELLVGAFNPNEDLLVRKYQVILYCKFVGQRVVKLTQQHESQLIKIIQQWLQGGQEEKEAALEAIGCFGQIKEGFDAIYQCEAIIQPYMANFRSSNQTLKLKFLNSFQGVVKVDNVVPKSPGKIYSLFSLFGNEQSQFDLGTLQNSAVSYLKLLNIPIVDTEICALILLLVLIGWREILRSFVKVDIFQDYVVKLAQNKQILDLKKVLQKELLNLCDQEQEQDFKDFSKSLRERLKQKTTMMLVESEMK